MWEYSLLNSQPYLLALQMCNVCSPRAISLLDEKFSAARAAVFCHTQRARDLPVEGHAECGICYPLTDRPPPVRPAFLGVRLAVLSSLSRSPSLGCRVGRRRRENRKFSGQIREIFGKFGEICKFSGQLREIASRLLRFLRRRGFGCRRAVPSSQQPSPLFIRGG